MFVCFQSLRVDAFCSLLLESMRFPARSLNKGIKGTYSYYEYFLLMNMGGVIVLYLGI